MQIEGYSLAEGLGGWRNDLWFGEIIKILGEEYQRGIQSVVAKPAKILVVS